VSVPARAPLTTEEFATPAILSSQNDDPRIVLANRSVPDGKSIPLPRIWLVKATREERIELERRAAVSGRYLDRPDDFVKSLNGQ
jgi:hypothetical protein